MNDHIGVGVIGIGVLFDLFGCIGLIRLPEVYNRLQAATKCVSLGTCGIMFGIFLMEGFNALGIKSLVAIPFIFVTAPTAAHALARGAHIAGVPLWKKSVCDEYETEKGHMRKDKTGICVGAAKHAAFWATEPGCEKVRGNSTVKKGNKS